MIENSAYKARMGHDLGQRQRIHVVPAWPLSVSLRAAKEITTVRDRGARRENLTIDGEDAGQVRGCCQAGL